MKNVYIVEFPSNLGLKAPAPGKEPGVKYLPGWLKQHQLHNTINAANIVRVEAPAYDPVRDIASGILNIDAIAAYALQQAATIKTLLAKNKFPFVLGGDCSILTGVALALKQSGNYGIFYLDGHTDFMDVSLSSTGGIGGMAASVVTGNGNKKLTDILQLSPYIKEENLWCVGNREYDDVYEDEIRNSTATYISLEKLRTMGIQNCIAQFLTAIVSLDGFWLHIDVDVLDNDIMPCVDSPTPGGLSYAEFNELTDALFASDKLAGLEITILDPELDTSGAFTKAFVSNISSTFNKARQ